MSFMILKNAVTQQMKMMEPHGLFVTNADKDDLWDTYLGSFKPEDNPIFRERTEHDCSCCRQFIKSCGNVVSIIDGELVSIWDVNVAGTPYQVVADALSNLVKSNAIKSKFLHFEKHLGTDKNHEPNDDGVLTWNHFYHELDPVYIEKNYIDKKIGDHRTSVQTFKRALEEIKPNAIEVVLDLISQNSLYKGVEYEHIVKDFLAIKTDYLTNNEDQKKLFIWSKKVSGSLSGIRNTSIGTLLVDLSNGVELETAVKKYEAKVAPTNYKRPTALITKSMIENAEKKVVELGITDSLQRRYAHIDDITVNNTIFVNRDVKRSMGIFDDLKSDVAVDPDGFKKVEEIGIDKFISDVLPNASSIEIMFDNKHTNNLVSLIAPVTESAQNILKWNNNFSWSYNGEVTDSMMKDRVKKAGGDVGGVLRFSIQWNDGDNNQNDFDAHCIEPNGNLISFNNMRSNTSGVLDVDIVNPGRNIAVENIAWSDIDKMLEGEYEFKVHNYSHNGGTTGFTAEIEHDGVIHSYEHKKGLRNGEKVSVAKIVFDKQTGIKFIKSLDSTISSKEIWNINTQNWQNVSMVMHSPNHWDGQTNGNKHWFFMLTDCKNPDKSRGFYNEFLKPELTEHRKVFEVLGAKMKTDTSDNQLSGLGFSSTKRDSVLCKLSGSFNRVVKINF